MRAAVLLVALGCLGTAETLPVAGPTSAAVELNWSAPADQQEVARRIELVRQWLEALSPATAPATRPAGKPAEQEELQRVTGRLWQKLQDYLQRLEQAGDLYRQLAYRKSDDFLRQRQQRLAELVKKTAALQAEPIPDHISPDQIEALRQQIEDLRGRYAKLDREVTELGRAQAVLAAAKAQWVQQARELDEQISQAHKELAEVKQARELRRDLPVTSPAKRLSLDRQLMLARVELAELELQQALLPVMQARASLVLQQDERLIKVLKPYVVALRERANALERRQIQSDLQWVRYRHEMAGEPVEKLYYGLELHVLQAEHEFNAFKDPISSRFQDTTLGELKRRIEQIELHWRSFMPSLGRRSGQQVLAGYRRVRQQLRWAQKRLVELQQMYDYSSDELSLLQVRQSEHLERFDQQLQRFDELAASSTDPRVARLGANLIELRNRLVQGTQAIIVKEQQLIERLGQGIAAVQGCLDHLARYRSRLYRAHVGVRDRALFDRPWPKMMQEWAELARGRLVVSHADPTAPLGQRQRVIAIGDWLGQLRRDVGAVWAGRWLLAGILIVAAIGATIWLRPKLAALAEQVYRQTTGQPDFADRLGSQAARIGYRSAPVVWPLVGVLAAIWSLGVASPLARIAMALLLLLVVVWLGLGLVHGLFNPSKPRFRLIRCSNVVANYYRRWLRRLLWVSLVMLPLPVVLATGNVLPETRTFSRELYKAVGLVLLLLFLLRRQAVLRVVGRPEQVRMRHVFGLIRQLYPLGLLCLAGLVVMQVLGYYVLSEYVVASVAATVGLLLVARVAQRCVEELAGRYRRRAAQQREQARQQAERRARAEAQAAGRSFDPTAVEFLAPPELEGLVNAAVTAFRWVLAAAVLLAVLWVWGISLVDVRTMLSARVFGRPDRQITVWRIAGAVIAIVAAVLVSRSIRSLLRARVYPEYPQIDRGAQAAINTVLHYLLVLVGIYVAMQLLYLPLGAVAVLMGMLGLGLGLGLQPLFVNFLSGLIILFERHIKVGDIVDVGGNVGEVTRVSMRSTSIRTFDNIDMVIPNADFVTSSVINWSLQDRRIRGQIDVGVAYGSDVQLVRRLLLEVARAHPHVLPEPAPTVWFMDFGDNALVFKLLVWIDDVSYRMSTLTELRFAIDASFREHGVEIPFPQRTVSLLGDKPLKVEMTSQSIERQTPSHQI